MVASDVNEPITEPTGGSRVVHTLEMDGAKISVVTFEPGLRLPRHVHETACLTVVLAGSFAERFDHRAHELEEATMLAKPPGEAHSDAFGRDGSRQVILEYDEPALDALPRGHPFGERVEGASLRAHALGRTIERELASPDAFAPLAVEGMTLELVALAGRVSAEPPREAPPWLERARELLHERFLEAPACEELAAEAGVHPATLSRAFRASYGVGMADYARRLRLEWAARELVESARPISAIALAAGFADQSHFTRWFRRFSGLTPRRYRLHHRR